MREETKLLSEQMDRVKSAKNNLDYFTEKSDPDQVAIFDFYWVHFQTKCSSTEVNDWIKDHWRVIRLEVMERLGKEYAARVEELRGMLP